MPSLEHLLSNGVIRTAALRHAGVTVGELRAAIRAGRLRRVRRGWVCRSDADLAVVQAVALGGRLACICAARHLGLWAPGHDQRLHIARPRHAGRRFGDASGTVEHWTSGRWRDDESPVEPIERIVRDVLWCCEREDAVAIIDSALHVRRIGMPGLRRAIRGMPARFHSVLEEVDGASESGLESLCRFRLAELGLDVRSQVTIEGVGRVDLLVEGRLVIETDGREWHEGPEAFERDRARDLTLTRLGYVVLRLSYRQVMREWMLVVFAVNAVLTR